MMKLIIIAIFLAVVAIVGAAIDESKAETIENISDIHPDGSYSYRYATSNGISAQEAGVGGESANGAFGYTSPNGEPIVLTYVADGNGFQPQGTHLPTPPSPPAVPEYVIRLLKWLHENPSEDDGSYKA